MPRSATALSYDPLQVPGAIHVPVKTVKEEPEALVENAEPRDLQDLKDWTFSAISRSDDNEHGRPSEPGGVLSSKPSLGWVNSKNHPQGTASELLSRSAAHKYYTDHR